MVWLVGRLGISHYRVTDRRGVLPGKIDNEVHCQMLRFKVGRPLIHGFANRARSDQIDTPARPDPILGEPTGNPVIVAIINRPQATDDELLTCHSGFKVAHIELRLS